MAGAPPKGLPHRTPLPVRQCPCLVSVCTRDISPEAGTIERLWHVAGRTLMRWARELFPSCDGVFIRAAKESAGFEREFVVGQRPLTLSFAKVRKLKFPRRNACSEGLSEKASHMHPWAWGQRCVIPAAASFEPCREAGEHVP